jgi:hypothetical protein
MGIPEDPMATRRERNEKNERERERFLREIATVETFEAAWSLVMRGRDATFRSNAGYALRFDYVPRCSADEQRVYGALLAKLKAKGYRWEKTEGASAVLHPDGKILLVSP